jgi:hypothetical protein
MVVLVVFVGCILLVVLVVFVEPRHALALRYLLLLYKQNVYLMTTTYIKNGDHKGRRYAGKFFCMITSLFFHKTAHHTQHVIYHTAIVISI